MTTQSYATEEPTEHVTFEPVPGPRHLWALIRIALGWTFLWAFLDKTFGFGFATENADAWLNGGSPTTGYLAHATSGPFADVFQAMAGSALVDWLFMVGLLGLGVSLTLGIGMRVARWAGITMMALMWLSAFPPENNPFLDDHLVYALVLAVLPSVRAGASWGLGTWWSQTALVERAPILR